MTAPQRDGGHLVGTATKSGNFLRGNSRMFLNSDHVMIQWQPLVM